MKKAPIRIILFIQNEQTCIKYTLNSGLYESWVASDMHRNNYTKTHLHTYNTRVIKLIRCAFNIVLRTTKQSRERGQQLVAIPSPLDLMLWCSEAFDMHEQHQI